MNFMNYMRAQKNKKVIDFTNDILRKCEQEKFSIADMKDLSALLPSAIEKSIISNDENNEFTNLVHLDVEKDLEPLFPD